jgi:hypothetical protein
MKTSTVWIAQFVHGNYGDFNATHYSRIFNNYFESLAWLKEHSQHWNNCHRITGARQCSVSGDYSFVGSAERIYF